MKKLPPYGQYLYNLSKQNKRINLSPFIFCGFDAWRKARFWHSNNQRPSTMCLPPWESAFKYYWPVQGYDICLFDTGGSEDNDYLDEVVFVLLEHDARLVVVSSPDTKTLFYRKDSTNER